MQTVDKHLNVILTTQTIKFVEIRAVFTVPTLRAAAAGGCSQEVGVNVGFVTNKEFLPRNSATSEFNLISKMIVGKLLKYLEKIAHSSKNDENVILDRISFKGL